MDEDRWEARQLFNSGVLPASACPTFFDLASGAGILGVFKDGKAESDDEESSFSRGHRRPYGNSKMGYEKNEGCVFPSPFVDELQDSPQRSASSQSGKRQRQMRDTKNQEPLDIFVINPEVSESSRKSTPEAPADMPALAIRGNVAGDPAVNLPYTSESALRQTMGLNGGRATTSNNQDKQEGLPISKQKLQLCDAIRRHRVLVVVGETGSGKSTQMVQYMAEMGLTDGGRMIGCTQPRRVAASSVAERVAQEVGCKLGQEVGYTVRFEDCTTSGTTLIKFMTDGMLLREYLIDRNLSRYAVVILDEVHERTIQTDVLLGVLKDLVSRRGNLRLVVASATLDADNFSKFLFDCPVYVIPGRMFPVEVLYSKKLEMDYVAASVATAMQIHPSKPPGDILLFLSGQEEIDSCCESLRNEMKALQWQPSELLILPVYGALPPKMQRRIFDVTPPGARKVVVATNIAEASLTIDGIKYVVDSGVCKQEAYNPKDGISSLVVTTISQASARQRAGRAGRTGPGTCCRLYTKAFYKDQMSPSTVPEIQRVSLSGVVLQLKVMGIKDLSRFDFMDSPSAKALECAVQCLRWLGALDPQRSPTNLGRKMAGFPLDPQLSKTLISSANMGCADEILTIVAMLAVGSSFYRPRAKQAQADEKKAAFFHTDGDHLMLLAVYKSWKESCFSDQWCFEHFIHSRTMRHAREVRRQLKSMMNESNLEIVSAGRDNYDKVQRAIASGFFMHAAKLGVTEGYRTMAGGSTVYVHPSSALFNKPREWVLYHEVVITSKEYMRHVMAVEPALLVELAPQYYKAREPHNEVRKGKSTALDPLYDRLNARDRRHQ